MAGALTEFGRKSTGYKITVFVLIGAVLGALYYAVPYKRTKRRLAEARVENKRLLDESQKLDDDAKKAVELRKELDTITRIINENQKALPTEAELPAFFDTLGRKVGEAQVEVRRWDYQKEVPIESYVKVPVEIEISGTFFQLKRFFSSLAERGPAPTTTNPDGTTRTEERERIVTIENLQIYDPRVKNRELVMTAKFTASTFRQDAPAPVEDDKAKGGKKPAGAAGSGSAAGSAGSGSALPPAATPAGAKARTEDALKKDQDRLDQGLGSAGPTGSAKLQGGVP